MGVREKKNWLQADFAHGRDESIYQFVLEDSIRAAIQKLKGSWAAEWWALQLLRRASIYSQFLQSVWRSNFRSRFEITEL